MRRVVRFLLGFAAGAAFVAFFVVRLDEVGYDVVLQPTGLAILGTGISCGALAAGGRDIWRYLSALYERL